MNDFMKEFTHSSSEYMLHPAKPVDINYLIQKFIDKTQQEISFIQIGANDGTKIDAIEKYIKRLNWRGVMVEPVSYLFNRLQKTYKDNDKIRFENSAISYEDGKQTIYRLKEQQVNLPDWYDGLASFKKEVILSHKDQIPDIHKLIIEEEISTITFTTLLNKYNIKHVHILQIDTEGYDFEIIKGIDFTRIKPEIIIYEFCHLTVYSYYESVAYLTKNGYQVFRSYSSLDMIAIDADLINNEHE